MATHPDTSPEINLDPSFINENIRIGVVTAEWNDEITGSLERGAVDTLKKYLKDKQVTVKKVPGSFELPLGAQYLIEYGQVDAVICIGCLIRGETPHFDYISEAVSQKIGDLNLRYTMPVIFGVLTTETLLQAQERAGGKLGNKGAEAAMAALKMLELKANLKSERKNIGFS